MEIKSIRDKRAQIGQLSGFFQIMMLVIIFAGLTFIVAEKFITVSYKPTTGSVANETTKVINATGYNMSVASLRNCNAVVTYATNITSGAIIVAANYTVTNCYIVNTTASYGNQAWNISYTYSYSADTMASNSVNDTSTSLYDYGIGFLGIVILVVMVYLIISIVSGKRSGAR